MAWGTPVRAGRRSGRGPGGPAGGVVGATVMTTMLTLMLKEQLGPAHCAYRVRIQRSPSKNQRDQAVTAPFPREHLSASPDWGQALIQGMVR